MASSSSSNYEVFLSFRGEDTREGFTSHLYAGLCRKKIKTFIDEELRRGDEISPALLDAIEGSKISVIIFSKYYASSKWCLNELVKILECKETNGQIVVPVFFHVHPSDVRKQTGSFGEAFVKHESNFKEMLEMVQKWRAALEQASYLSGYESEKIKPEAKLVEVIVEDILQKLENMTISTKLFEDLIGLDLRIGQIKSLLGVGLPDCRILGICGMGGIGKTTLATALFQQISSNFEGKCFMGNVREKLEKGCVLEDLQKQLLSQLLEEDLVMGGFNIRQYTKERLRRIKVFVVLDDVNEMKQLDYLVGQLRGFGPGSRIVITTRDKQVLEDLMVDNIYELTGLDDSHAIQLFCKYAFRQNHPPHDLKVLLWSTIHYAEGNPLALKVLGSFFHRKDKQEWENALHNLKRITNCSMYDVLKISYDELKSDEKHLFLDIACFFKGYRRDHVVMILNDDHFSVYYGLNVLVNKSLITLSDERLEMHDFLQELGYEIVRQESTKDPGQRSRLWNVEDVYHVLKKNKGTNSIEGLFLDMSKIRDLNLTSEVFAKMSNLRLLKFYMPNHYDDPNMSSKVHLPRGLDYLPDELRYLHWHGYPLKSLPYNFSPENLIELNLPYSKLERLWEGEKEAFKLRSIDVHHCQCLTQIPDPMEIPNIEEINLSNCTKLPSISPSIHGFNNLSILSLKGCESLRCFPSNICFRSPIEIDLSDCVNLKEFPRISGNIIGLSLCNTAIEEIPSLIKCLINLLWLNLTACARLKSISTSICKLKSLRSLTLYKCSSLENFPQIMEEMGCLKHIDLRSTLIKELPSSIEQVGLRDLRLDDCSKFMNLPENLGNLKSLVNLRAQRLALSQLPSSITKLNEIKSLNFSGCKGLVLPPLSVFARLTLLYLSDCDITEIPEDISCLSSLIRLNLSGNNFKSLPASIKQLWKLETLTLSNCDMLQSIPELPIFLRVLHADNCKRLASLPELPSFPEELNASLLQVPSKRRSLAVVPLNITADFANCHKLNEKDLADAELRIQHMIILSLRLFYTKVNLTPNSIKMFLPGSVIPSLFSNQRTGSSITIQLPPHGPNRRLIGFALCAVIEIEEDFYACQELFKVICHLPEANIRLYFMLHDIKLLDRRHVFLGFVFCHNNWPPKYFPDGDHHAVVSFEFMIYPALDQYYHDGPTYHKVKCCGVCPVYANPNETKPNTFTLKFEEECTKIENSNVDSGDKASTSGTDEWELEPSPKRNCREQINNP